VERGGHTPTSGCGVSHVGVKRMVGGPLISSQFLARGWLWVRVLVLVQLGLIAAVGADLQTYGGCEVIAVPWADGDSFSVRFPDGQVRTVRLYGVDCLESSESRSEVNVKRLSEQKRWFGIQQTEVAQKIGQDGKRETHHLLSAPFSVHTSFTDARGDARYDRIYGFVTLSDGRDLSEHLVSAGYARAYGMARSTPRGVRAQTWQSELRKLEANAARAGLGAWRHSDWSRLSEKRRSEYRGEKGSSREPGSGTESRGPFSPMDFNSASREQLITIPGVGDVMAKRIIDGRPYTTMNDLLKVPGIGPKVLEKIRAHGFVRSSIR
jgi:competence protein ComEA